MYRDHTVPLLIFTILFQNRHTIKKLGGDLEQHNKRHSTHLSVAELARSRRLSRRESFANLAVQNDWLIGKFEKYSPERWYAGICYLAVRLVQTSFMAMVRTQLVQAGIVCSITLLVAIVQREFSPFSRASDNHVALLTQMLIFSWIFIFLLRLSGMFQRIVAAAIVGTLLCVASVAVFVVALHLANTDRINEKRAEQQDAIVPDSSTIMTGDEQGDEQGGDSAAVGAYLEETAITSGPVFAVSFEVEQAPTTNDDDLPQSMCLPSSLCNEDTTVHNKKTSLSHEV